MADLVPGLVLGLITSVATRQPTSLVSVAHLMDVPPSPSSQVMNSTVEALRYCGLFKIAGTWVASQWSPWPTVPSCMSLTRFGVMNENAGSGPCARSPASLVNGTSFFEQPFSEV